MFWETYLSDKTNIQIVISLKKLKAMMNLWTNDIVLLTFITRNNDQKVKVVKQLMTGIRTFVRK